MTNINLLIVDLDYYAIEPSFNIMLFIAKEWKICA